MSVFLIQRFPDPLLKQATRPVERLDENTQLFIDRLLLTMRHHPRCVGLAAPQVGSSLRIAVMDSSRHPKGADSQGLIVLVNPSIGAAEGSVCQREGCLSIPDFTANVRRATRVRVTALDAEGIQRTWQFHDFEAIIAQHEIDHLDGKLFLDRVANLTTDVFRRKDYA